ncbi:MAG TPA: PDZ domain-containing protein [Gemmatimonadaceae bacterium]|jgi:tricorn protease|nr:PDZ domain-containing protein [Gemmatimonadaceae bacterium]
MRSTTRFILPLVLLPGALVAQTQAGSAGVDGASTRRDDDTRGTRLLRHPTVSATQVAFAYAGDIWIAPRDGGDARRLTTSAGVEQYPRFSPDGRSIAFSGEYAGNTDVYVVSADGGDPKRLTWHPGDDLVRGWTPDGKRVVFASGRVSAPTPVPKLWTVGVDGGLPAPMPMPLANRGMHSPDGKRFAYQSVTFNDLEWRNYRGGQAQPIRILTLADLEMTKVPANGSVDSDPVWLGDKVYFISDRNDMANVWSYDPATKAVAQVTHFKDFDVKNLQAGAGMLVFEQAGYIHEVDAASGREKQIVVHVRGDLPAAQEQWKDVTRLIQHASLSPTGARALFEARGDVFTVPVEKGDWRNLTHSSGAADRNPVWSPDGQKIAWFSDAGGEYQLMIGSQQGTAAPRAIKLQNPSFYFTPTWSPDSKQLVFTDVGLNVWVVNVESGAAKKIDTDQWMVPARTVNPTFSPDSKWLAYTKRLPNQFHAVFVHSLADGTTHQVTDGLSDIISPAWDASGKYLYMLGSTDFGLNTGWLDMTSYDRPVTRAIYFAVLRNDDASPLLPESDDEKAAPTASTPPVPRPMPDTARAARPTTGTGAPVVSTSDSARAASGTASVRIDFDGIEHRILSIDVPARNYLGLSAGPAGVVFYSEAIPNQPGLTLYRYDVKTRRPQAIVGSIANYDVSANGKKLLYQTPGASGGWFVVDADKPVAPGNVTGRLNMQLRSLVNPREEWQQIFREAWRLERDFFYVRNMHGADWPKVYAMYAPWVDYVGHRSDLTHLLDILGGELSVGHSFVSEGDRQFVDPIPVGMLGADFEESNGRYRLKNIYTGENWNPELRAPLAAPGIKVSEGNYVLAVNGVELRAPDSPYRLFEGTTNRQTVLTVNDKPTMDGSHEITVVPIANETALRSRAWVEGNRHIVDRLSQGKLAYVWLPNTGGPGYAYFNRYYFAQQDKQGAVVDERFNGGGSAADYMVDLMSRQLHGYFNNPVGDRKLFTTPQAGIWGPKVMVINEYAGSGGDLLPFMFRHAKVGPLVGERTWGGLVGIWDTQLLVDGGTITNPRGGFIDVNGKWAVENEGVPPDIEVELTPKDLAAGHDPQLERAVNEALRLLAQNPPKAVTEPAAPIRSKRPPN